MNGGESLPSERSSTNFDSEKEIPTIPLLRPLDFNCSHLKSEELARSIDESLREAALQEIHRVLAPLNGHPLVRAVRNFPSLPLQNFFVAQDEAFDRAKLNKPIFFSPRHKGIVISQSDLDVYLSQYVEAWEQNPHQVIRELREFAVNRLEFSLHEFGHIAAFNGAIVVDSEQRKDLWNRRQSLMKLFELYPNKDIVQQRFPHVLSDVRAEVLRHQIDFVSPYRSIESFARVGVENRVLRGSPLRCPAFRIDAALRMLVWYPISKAMGPEGYDRLVLDEVVASSKEFAPSMLSIVKEAAQFLDDYFMARTYDQSKFLEALDACKPGE